MKLADLYSPHMYELEHNAFYPYFQEYFIETFREPEKRHPEREKVSHGKYIYQLSEQEVEFYQTLYVQQGKILPITSVKELGDIPTLTSIGEHVKDLIDFVFNISDQLGFLIAPVGWGKTVLLKYVWFYLINQSATLARKARPIYIAVDHWKADIERRGGKDIVQLLEELLQQRIAKILREEGIAKLDDEEFWSFLIASSDAFSILGQQEEDLKSIYDSDTAKREIAKIRAQSRGSKDYYYMALKYLRTRKGVTPVLLIDNVDQLRIEKDIREMVKYVILLTREYDVKILVTLRTQTYYQILQSSDILLAYPPAVIKVQRPNLENYISKRVKYVSEKIQQEGKKFEYVGRSKISFKDAAEVYRYLLEVLLNEESQKVLDFIGRSNLRVINSFILEYLSSGYIDTDEVIRKVMEKKLLGEVKGETVGKTPLWILLATIITHNYKTRFSRIALRKPQMDVVNLYCNGREFPGQFFTRIHILSYIRNDHSEGTNLQELIEDYKLLFPNQEVKRWLRRALFKLSVYGLIETEDCASPSSPQDIECLKHFRLTRTGEYYLDEFRNYYEYLVYMKDDVELTSEQIEKYRIKDCITVESLRGRFDEVTKFLRLLYDEEKNFLLNLNRDQRRLFRKKFALRTGACFLVVSSPIETLLKFGETRKESADISKTSIQRLYGLQQDLSEFCREYKK